MSMMRLRTDDHMDIDDHGNAVDSAWKQHRAEDIARAQAHLDLAIARVLINLAEASL